MPQIHSGEPTVSEPHETLVRWYLRFNGYFGVENFVLHSSSMKGIAQAGESDVLAVRFPHSRELAGFRIPNDTRLIDQEAKSHSIVDFVIAEVKGGKRAGLNNVWMPPDPDGSKVERVAYVIRWLGPFSDESMIRDVASELQTQHRSRRGPYLFRLVYFARIHQRKVHQMGISQITFSEIAEFFVRVRAPCWRDHGLGVRSAHDQWDSLIKRAWKIGDPDAPGSDEEKIEQILSLLE